MNISVPYSDFVQLEQDATKLESVKTIIETKFPDDTCQIIAIKSVLGIEEEKDEPDIDAPEEPEDPEGSEGPDTVPDPEP